MIENKYEKLERMRTDLARDKEKLLKLQEQVKIKEIKLKEAEATRIVADVNELNLTPEQLGEFLMLIQSGKIDMLNSDATIYRPAVSEPEPEEEEEEVTDETNIEEEDQDEEI